MEPNFQLIKVADRVVLLILINIRQEKRDHLEWLIRGTKCNIRRIIDSGFYPNYYGIYELSGEGSLIVASEIELYLNDSK
ncbi:hypothetical protein QTG56_25705 (plasmid) [Rossellomorea sp. AcN35-11]|nr:hypothetical protein [Rossellomorea aquimaris]WJV32012.1 hypothetical protein QTG56_25705 [Rossellomorea sp. AcN35-11]